jgi:hypothetical protein
MKDFLKDLVICEFVDYSEGELLLIECVRSNINPYEMLGIVLNEFSLELSLKLDEHIVSNKINIAKFFEIYSQYVSSIKYIRKLFSVISNCTKKEQFLIYVMTNFYLYYNIFEKKNLQEIIFLSFNKDNYEENINLIKIMCHYKNFKIMFGAPFTGIPSSFNLALLDTNFMIEYSINNINDKIVKLNETNNVNEHELNQIIETIKVFTDDSNQNIRDEFMQKYKFSMSRRLKNNMNPQVESFLLNAFNKNCSFSLMKEFRFMINDAVKTIEFNKFLNSMENTDVNIVSEKYKNIRLPNLTKIKNQIERLKLNIIPRNQVMQPDLLNQLIENRENEERLKNQTNLINLDPQMSFAFDISKKVYSNFTENAKLLRPDYERSTIKFKLTFDKTYNFVSNIVQATLIQHINYSKNGILSSELATKMNLTLGILNKHINSLLHSKLILKKNDLETNSNIIVLIMNQHFTSETEFINLFENQIGRAHV